MKSVNRILFLLIALLLIASLPVVAADSARDTLYQISTIDALMAGLYDGRISIGELTKHGDFGLGTFDALDGEMIVMDGTVYQITSDGAAHKPAGDVTTPFAAVTFMDSGKRKVHAIPNDLTLPKLQEYLDSLLPSKNLFYAIKIDGAFTSVKTRSVPRQSKPYPRLIDVTAKQPVFEFTNVRGTIIALRCPYFVKGVNVPGYHMHFITADRARGGHLLDCIMKNGTATIDPTTKLELSLPENEDFCRTNFEATSQADVGKVEKGNR